MPATPNTSKTVPEAGQPADPKPRFAEEALERLLIPATQKTSEPQIIISEHQVMLGTAAATALAPSFEGELDTDDLVVGDPAAQIIAVPQKSGWLGLFARRAKTPRDRRPTRRYYPPRFDCDYIADARMAREMYRL